MTTNLKATRYHIRRVERPAPADPGSGDAGLFDTHDDGFGALDFRRDAEGQAPGSPSPGATPGPSEPPAAGTQQPAPRAETTEEIEAALAAIAAEGLTARQLR
ncbi:MAG: hypothetical protein ACK4FR_14045, partial [Tabrizicola sp.]